MKLQAKMISLGVCLQALMGVSSVSAQTLTDCVVVETLHGERMEYLLSDAPRITQTAGTVTLTTVSETLEMQAADIKKVYLSTTDLSAVESLQAAEGCIRLEGSSIVLSGYKTGAPVALFTADGRQLWQCATGSDGRLVVSLGRLAPGIYIVKTNSQSIKFMKK